MGIFSKLKKWRNKDKPFVPGKNDRWRYDTDGVTKIPIKEK